MVNQNPEWVGRHRIHHEMLKRSNSLNNGLKAICSYTGFKGRVKMAKKIKKL